MNECPSLHFYRKTSKKALKDYFHLQGENDKGVLGKSLEKKAQGIMIF